MSKYDDLMELLEDLQSCEYDRPESCSCHVNPPCNHCCYGPANEAMGKVDAFVKGWEDKE